MFEKRESGVATLFAVLLVVMASGGVVETQREHISLVATKHKPSAYARKLATVRTQLHRNLDGKANGFIRGWSFDAQQFTLTIDKSRYQQFALHATTMTARSIFDANGVALPKRLIIRDVSGAVLGDGAFANVPKIE
ncbi:MAG TPA: hypothetical protein VFN10_14315 [Thermoanaerobaculia bacterium]|nr:hypothetical protein [Thermoanaerobaculia bacterium]